MHRSPFHGQRPNTATEFIDEGNRLQATVSALFGCPPDKLRTTLTAYSHKPDGTPNPDTFEQTSCLRDLTDSMFRNTHVFFAVTTPDMPRPAGYIQILNGQYSVKTEDPTAPPIQGGTGPAAARPALLRLL